MEKISEKLQILAVEKVLEEMKKAEEFVSNWNASWYEQLSNAHCLPLHYEIGESDVRDMEQRYGSRYQLANAFYSSESIGLPLIKETLIGNNSLTDEKNIPFECEFGRVEWHSMYSNKSIRYFSFTNDGEICFSKDVKSRQTIKHSKQISYETSYNVLSNDFTIKFIIDELITNEKNKYRYDNLTFSLRGNILTKKINNIEIIQDLNTGLEVVRIEKKFNKMCKENNASVLFEAVLNPDDNLEMGAVVINTHKGNGKVNGTFRFDVSRTKGVRANFYSRKGVKVDLTTNSMLLEIVNTLLLQSSNNNTGDLIVSDFVKLIQKALAKDLDEEVISFDNIDFNMESIKQSEDRIIEMVKSIRGELPLVGLVERVDNCLFLLDNLSQKKLMKKQKL